MKLTQTWTIASLALSLSAAADQTYVGTFTETITSVENTSLYHVGDAYYGQYWYQSPTVDGTFTTPFTPYGGPPGSFPTLAGRIFAPFVPREPGEHSGAWWSFDYTANGGTLVVNNGQVTSFNWSFEYGGYFIGASGPNGVFAALSYYDRPIYNPATDTFDPTPYVFGTITFNPHPKPIPDAGSTACLVLLGAVALLGLHRVRRTTEGPAASRQLRGVA